MRGGEAGRGAASAPASSAHARPAGRGVPPRLLARAGPEEVASAAPLPALHGARVGLLAFLLAVGCGYQLAGRGAHVPEGARTISIRPFANRTREAALDVRLQQAIEDEFRRRGPLHVVPDPEGDLVLSGEIRRFAAVPVGFNATDEAVQYQGIMRITLRLVERSSNRTLYETKLLQVSQEFGAVSGVVIAGSPAFQRRTMNARDLPNLTNVQLGETGRREALRELLDQVARDVYAQAMEGF